MVLFHVTFHIILSAPAPYTNSFLVRCKIRERIDGNIRQTFGVDRTSSSDVVQILCRCLYVRAFNVEKINQEQCGEGVVVCPVAKPALIRVMFTTDTQNITFNLPQPHPSPSEGKKTQDLIIKPLERTSLTLFVLITTSAQH